MDVLLALYPANGLVRFVLAIVLEIPVMFLPAANSISPSPDTLDSVALVNEPSPVQATNQVSVTQTDAGLPGEQNRILFTGQTQEARVDLPGDPLPPGAIARAGTTRFRPGKQVWRVRYSGSGDEIASWSGGLFCRWDAQSGKAIDHHEFPGAGLGAIGFWEAGRSLAVLQSGDGEVHFWDFASGQEPPRVNPGPTSGVVVAGDDRERFATFAVSHDGTILAGATGGLTDRKRMIQLWRAEPVSSGHWQARTKNTVR